MKELLLTSRGCGKTTFIAEWVKNGRVGGVIDSGKRVMVVMSSLEKERVIHFNGLGEQEVEPLCKILGNQDQVSLREKVLYIDNLDVMLDAIFGTKVCGASFTVENYCWNIFDGGRGEDGSNNQRRRLFEP